MKQMRAFFLLAFCTLFALSACNLARGTTPGGSTGDPLADQQTQVALAVLQTQAAAGGAGVPDVPGATFTPSLTPSITLSPTPSVPMVTVSTETNCRTGPGSPYDIVGVLPVGVPAEVVGRNAAGDTWIIKLPSNPAVTCWLWGFYATVVGDTSRLPVFTPPPTPTPAAGFTVSFLNTVSCAPPINLFAFRFSLVNNGSITWESYRLVVYDSSTATTKTSTYDDFQDWTDCSTLTNTLDDLEPGEAGVAGNWGPTGLFNYNPAGHSMTATFTLCSQEGLTGTCKEKTITFVP